MLILTPELLRFAEGAWPVLKQYQAGSATVPDGCGGRTCAHLLFLSDDQRHPLRPSGKNPAVISHRSKTLWHIYCSVKLISQVVFPIRSTAWTIAAKIGWARPSGVLNNEQEFVCYADGRNLTRVAGQLGWVKFIYFNIFLIQKKWYRYRFVITNWLNRASTSFFWIKPEPFPCGLCKKCRTAF